MNKDHEKHQNEKHQNEKHQNEKHPHEKSNIAFDKSIDATLFKCILMLVPKLGVCKPCFKSVLSLNNTICSECLSKYANHFEEKGIEIKKKNYDFSQIINNINERLRTFDVFYIDNKPAIKVKEDGLYKLGKPHKVPDKLMTLKKNYNGTDIKLDNGLDCLNFVIDLFFTHSKME